MSHYAIVVDLDRCIGCHSCEIACKNEYEVDLGITYNKVQQVGPFGTYPHLQQYFLPYMCQQCEDAPCVEVCPTGASQKLDDGTVQVDEATCIGCGLCVSACPYDARYVDEQTQVAMKCTMCKELTDQGELPECVAACTGSAMHFGDLDDPDSDVARLVAQAGEHAYVLQDSGNDPANVYILDKMTWRS